MNTSTNFAFAVGLYKKIMSIHLLIKYTAWYGKSEINVLTLLVGVCADFKH